MRAAVLVLLTASLASGATAAARTGSETVGIDSAGFRVGSLVWKWKAHDRAVGLADLRRAFGRPTSCRPLDHAPVVWRTAGVRGIFTTLGSFPRPGDNACNAPDFVQPETVDVFTRRWRTARGLRVGDPVGRVRELYPRAGRHPDGWWLVVRRKDPLRGTYGELVAGVRSGRIAFLRLVLHAEGD